MAAIAVVVATASFYGRGATAQTPPGSPSEAAQPFSQASTAFTCGAELSSVIRTWEQPATISSSSPVTIPAAALNVTIPAGDDCVIVTFSAEMRSGVSNICVVRALLGPTEMSPTGDGARIMAQENPDWGARTYVWAERITVPSTTQLLVQIQMWSLLNTIICEVDDWVLQISRKN
jgi:hypothetical protein